MIPEGWQEAKLQDVAPVIDCKHKTPRYTAQGVPIVSPGNLAWGALKLDGCRTISESDHAEMMDHCSVAIGDVVFGRNQSVGVSSIVTTDSPFALGQDTVLIKPTTISPGFLHQWLQSRQFELSILRLQGGSTFGRINLKDLRAVPTPVPPSIEADRIAETLQTWDRAIETVEALIANARAQKQALMQQLLPQGTTPPKKRLPGFSGEWRETTIEGVASVLVSNVDKKSVKGERPVRLCNYMDVYRSDQIVTDMDFMAATATDAQIRKFGLTVGDVIITKDSETPDDIAIPTIVQSTAPDLVCGYHLAILRPMDGTDGQFLKFFFEHPRTRHFFASRANGATRFGLTVGAIETAPISLPSHAEQKEIGNVILAAETEIHQLNPILTALRQEKAALMQQLLTGKRRVKLPESEVA